MGLKWAGSPLENSNRDYYEASLRWEMEKRKTAEKETKILEKLLNILKDYKSGFLDNNSLFNDLLHLRGEINGLTNYFRFYKIESQAGIGGIKAYLTPKELSFLKSFDTSVDENQTVIICFLYPVPTPSLHPKDEISLYFGIFTDSKESPAQESLFQIKRDFKEGKANFVITTQGPLFSKENQ